MNLKNKNILLVGLAKTGVSTIKLLNKLEANIIVNDIKDKEKLKDILKELEYLDKAKEDLNGDLAIELLQEMVIVTEKLLNLSKASYKKRCLVSLLMSKQFL